jgi:hypothetical protein
MAGFHLPMAGWFCLPTDTRIESLHDVLNQPLMER